MVKKSVLILIVLGNICSAQAMDDGEVVLLSTGAAVYASAAYDHFRLDSNFERVGSLDDVIRSPRTPNAGQVTIFQEPTPANFRSYLQRELINHKGAEISALVSRQESRLVIGRAAKNQASAASIATIEKRLGVLATISDEELMRRMEGKLPSTTFTYDGKADLRNILRQSAATGGNAVRISFLADSAHMAFRAARAGAAASLASFMVVNSLNPKSSVETAGSEEIKFAETSEN